MQDTLHRLYQAKLTLLAVILLFVGLGLLIFGHWIQHEPHWAWLANWPILDIGSGMFTTGLLGVALQYLDSADSEVRDTQRLQRVLTASAPQMRDAVIDGFAFEPQDLARVATPAVLDQIATNALGIRLGDVGFASEIYADIKQQTIDVPERLHDARITIRLTPPTTSTARQRRDVFVATIRWEFTLTPVFATRRFVCLSDISEFRDLSQDTGATSAWYVGPRTRLDAGEKDTFELVEFSVDGHPRPIRRTTKAGAQTYTVSLGEDAIRKQKPVTLTYTYRALVSAADHLLRVRVDQPTRGLAVELDYSDTDISYVNVLDFIASGDTTRVNHSPATVPSKTVTVDFDGWVLPRSGIAFVWVTQPAKPPTTRPTASHR